MTAPNPTKLDPGQVLQGAFVDADGALRVDIASGGSGGGSAGLPGDLISYDFAVPVDNTAFVEILAATAAAYTAVEIFCGAGVPLILGFGAAAAEVPQIYIMPGGNGRINLTIPINTRLSIKAFNTTANTDVLLMNTYS